MSAQPPAMLSMAEREIILAFAENDMHVKQTARALYRSSGGMWYPFKKIKEHTGLDPRKFYDLIQLVNMCREGEHCCETELPGTPERGPDANCAGARG